jgi:uncharacterized phiE125 gp8 family phage protein
MQNDATERIFYTRTVAPTAEPLTLDDALRHVQCAVSGDNGYVVSLIQVARDVAEGATGQILAPSTWRGVCEEWPESGRISITLAPVNAVSSVKYYPDGGGALVTVSSSLYTVSTDVSPAVITFSEDFTYPDLFDRPDAIQVNFTAGYSSPSTVPPSIKHAVRILVRKEYDQPGGARLAAEDTSPAGLYHLLYSNRVSGWTA